MSDIPHIPFMFFVDTEQALIRLHDLRSDLAQAGYVNVERNVTWREVTLTGGCCIMVSKNALKAIEKLLIDELKAKEIEI